MLRLVVFAENCMASVGTASGTVTASHLKKQGALLFSSL